MIVYNKIYKNSSIIFKNLKIKQDQINRLCILMIYFNNHKAKSAF